MTINEYITKEQDAKNRLSEAHGSITADLVISDFYKSYEQKHPVTLWTDPHQYLNQRAYTLDRYVSMNWDA